MSCCFSKKCFARGHREDAYKVTDEVPNAEGDEAPKYSWDRRDKVDPSEYTIRDIHTTSVKKTGKDGGPLQIENCTDATIMFLHTTSQVIIDDCRHCTIVLGPTQGSVFIRDSTNCTVLTACQQLRTRDCTSIQIGILCSTEPIVENSMDIHFYSLPMKYSNLQEQMHSVGLRPYTNRVTSAYDFSPVGTGGKINFTVTAEALKLTDSQNQILTVNGIITKPTDDDFLPRFEKRSDEDPVYLYVLGKSKPMDVLEARAKKICHSIYKCGMKITATYDVDRSIQEPNFLPLFGPTCERMILIEAIGPLEKFECDEEFDFMSDTDMEKLSVQLSQMKCTKSE
uniref:Protein XRP2 n=1 Tax=Caenorhabditis tropicalis TaxID=1561998 RepID=A0A1I7TPV2_9PELO